MNATTTGKVGPDHPGTSVFESPLTGVAAIWTCTAVTSLLAPDMVTGSEQDHLPIALMTAWLWACVGSAYALMTPKRGSRSGWTVSVVVIWALMALVAIFAPVMATGTDPTSIPLAAMIAPPVAAVVTGMLSLRQANLPSPGA
jgi:hypothetical protein